MADLATLETWLSEAQQARHNIATGAGVLDVWRDGRRLRFAKQNLRELDRYIQSLETQITEATRVAEGKPKRRSIRIGWA